MNKIAGFRIELDKTSPKWRGTVQLKSSYKCLSCYVTSKSESFEDAVKDVIARYGNDRIEGLDLERVKEDEME